LAQVDGLWPNCALEVDLASLLPVVDLLNAHDLAMYHDYSKNETKLTETKPNETKLTETTTMFRANVFRDANLLSHSW